jgi:hypothetical protein
MQQARSCGHPDSNRACCSTGAKQSRAATRQSLAAITRQRLLFPGTADECRNMAPASLPQFKDSDDLKDVLHALSEPSLSQVEKHYPA